MKKKYTILYRKSARLDLLNIVDYIEKKLYSPLTAERFYYGIKKTIEELEKTADIYKIPNHPFITKYGHNTRRINYKDFAIIYTIEDSTIIVHRIVHGSLIT